MGSDWHKFKLGDLGSFRNGANFSKKDYAPGFPIVNVKQLYAHRYVETDNLLEVSSKAISNPESLFLKNGDILFARSSVKGSGAGQAAMISSCPENTIFSGFIIRFRIEARDIALPLFVNYLLRSDIYRELLPRIASGTTITNLSQGTLASLPILLPPLPEQRAIAHILGSLDDKIELNHRMNQTLEAMARAIFKHWFIDFEFPNDNGEPYKSSGGEMIDSPLGPIPKGWRIVKIKSLGNIVCGKTPPKKQRVFYENASIPFIKIPDMHNQVFAVNSNDTLSCEAINIMRKKLLPANSICVSCIATVGEVVITSRESFTNQQINSIVPRKKYLVYYTYFMMKELQNTLVQMASGGSATLNLNTKEFSNTSIIFPSESTIFRFHETVECLFQRILLNQTEINALASLRDILLPKLMSGEIRVPVSEKEDDQL